MKHRKFFSFYEFMRTDREKAEVIRKEVQM